MDSIDSKQSVILPDGLDTSTLDKLYLEWSQITSAVTRRERDLAAEVSNLASKLANSHDVTLYEQHLASNEMAKETEDKLQKQIGKLKYELREKQKECEQLLQANTRLEALLHKPWMEDEESR